MELSYFWPNELSLRIIICIILGVAFFVLSQIALLVRKGKVNLEMITELEDVSYLEKTLRELENFDTDWCFQNFENLKDKDVHTGTEALFEHLHAIYDAGAKSSRLDADLLVKNTVAKIFDKIGRIKTLISLFLIIGILGTLVGLATSIGSFSGEGFLNVSQGSGAQQTAEQLSKLFSNLKGAFGPSMWGVACTIIFVFGFTIVQEKIVNKLSEKLTLTTIKVWLPKLYPTDFKKAGTTMGRLNDTIKNASNINQGAADLLNNLDAANSSVAKLKEVSESFKEVINFQNALQSTLNDLRDKDKETNNILKETAAAIVPLQTLSKNIEEYNKNFFEKQEVLQKQLEEGTQKIDKSVEPIQTGLKNVSSELKRISDPLVATKDAIYDLFNGIVGQQEAMMNDLVKKLDSRDNKCWDVILSNNGISKESRQAIVDAPTVDTSVMERKLGEILLCLEKTAAKNGSNISPFKEKEDNIIKKFLPVVLGVLLFISIIVQGFMAMKLANLQDSQNAVTKIVIEQENQRVAREKAAKAKGEADKKKALEEAKATEGQKATTPVGATGNQ